MGIKMMERKKGARENWEGGREWKEWRRKKDGLDESGVGKVQAAVGEVEEQEEVGPKKREKEREKEREKRVSEDHSNINVPGPEKRSGDIP